MKSSFTAKPGSIISLKVELAPEEFTPFWQNAFDKALSQVNLKGFRPGQAPKEIAAKAVDSEKVFEQAANNAIRETLNQMTAEQQWTVIDQPKVTIESESKGFIYTADLTVFPEVNLRDYKKIAQKIIAEATAAAAKAQVTEEEADKAFQWLKEHGANLANFKTDADLKKSINKGLLLEKKEREREKGRMKMIKEIIAVSEMEIPQVMIDRAKTSHNFSEEQARKEVAGQLIIYKIAKAERLEPTEAEINEELKHLAGTGAKMDSEQSYNYVYAILQNRKVFEFLEKQ